MRNLKRALSLALSSAMVLGMMVMGAGAVSYSDFGDKDEIVNKDAVSMVTALGIINGLPSGDYGPTQNIDRASFVKMVCLTLNGGAEPVLPASTKASYVDTAGTWAESYIEYCTNLGIAAGDGTTGKFNPTANVTVSQAAKMLLVALGYNASIEGYVGMDWQMNVDVAANLAGLYKGISGSTSAPATRDQAAQMIFNALDATVVKYDSSFEVNTAGQVTARPQVNNDPRNGTLLENKFEAVKVVGVVVGNEYAALEGGDLDGATTDAGKTYIHIIEQPRSNLVINNSEVDDGAYRVASTPDMLGKSVTMFVRMSGGTTSPAKATVLGNLILTEDNSVVTLSEKKDSNEKIVKFLRDKGMQMVDGTQYYVNYDLKGSGKTAMDANFKGMTADFIDYDGDNKVDVILQTVKTFGEVTSYISKDDGAIYVTGKAFDPDVVGFAKEANLNDKDAKANVNGFEDVAKDDYVFFYQVENDWYVEKAEYVDVTVTSKKGGDTVVAGGKEYTQSQLTEFVNEEDGGQDLYTAISVGDEVRLFLDDAGYVVWTDAAESDANYLYVTKSTANTNDFYDTIEVKVVFADGSTGVIDVDVDEMELDGDKKVATGIYSYTKNSKNVYTLTPATDKDGVTVKNNTDKITQGKANSVASGILANDSTIFVVSRGSSYTVYTGINNVPTLEKDAETGNFNAIVVAKDKVAKVVFVTECNLTGKDEGIYVLSAAPSVTLDANGDEVYTYDVVYKGKATTLTGDKNLYDDEGYYEDAQVNGGEIVKAAAGSLVAPAKAVEASKGVIKTAGVTCTYTSETEFIIVDGTDVTEAGVGEIIIADDLDETDNVVIVDAEDDGIAEYVFICR